MLPAPITSRANGTVKALRHAFSGKASRPGDLVGIEGPIALREALRAGLRIDAVVVKAEALREIGAETLGLRASAREFHVLRGDVFDSVVNTVTPQAVAATVFVPEEGDAAPVQTGIFLLLEDIQDPGNLGTLLRSAEAFGVERVYLSPRCANAWSPKVIRASAGSVFRVPMTRLPILAAADVLRAKGVRMVAAVVKGASAHVSYGAELRAPIAIAIGNEGAGLTASAIAAADGTVYVPCGTESLNAAVAGSVLLYEVQRGSSGGVGNSLARGREGR